MPDATERLRATMPQSQLAVAKGALEVTAKAAKIVKRLQEENKALKERLRKYEKVD